MKLKSRKMSWIFGPQLELKPTETNLTADSASLAMTGGSDREDRYKKYTVIEYYKLSGFPGQR